MFVLTILDGVLTASFMAINLGVMGTTAIYRLVYGKPKSDLERFIEWYEDREKEVKEKDSILKYGESNSIFKVDRRASL